MFFKNNFNVLRQLRTEVMAVALLVLSVSSYAQENEVIELQSLLDNSKSISKINSGEVEEIRSLVFELQPTIFVSSAGIKLLGEGEPVKAEVNSNDIGFLQAAKSDLKSVKLLIVSMEQKVNQNDNFDFSTLNSAHDLKYLLFTCSYNCDPARILNSAIKLPKGVRIFYTVSIPQ